MDGTMVILSGAKRSRRNSFYEEYMKAEIWIFLTLMILPISMHAQKTVEDRVAELGTVVNTRLKPLFDAKGIAYPPAQLTFIGLKQEGFLQVYAAGPEGEFKHIKTYPILAESGGSGPKLRESDGQVPEGLYKIESLNPNSRFHLSLRVNYPNELDRKMAKIDKRTRLGGDIMIHGSHYSIGCLAMGDPAAEDLFVLAAKTGLKNISVILSPIDFRVRNLQPGIGGLPTWTDQLYQSIRKELEKYPYPSKR